MNCKITVFIATAAGPSAMFVEDRKPGQTKGEGSRAFGAGWDAISLAGKKIESDD